MLAAFQEWFHGGSDGRAAILNGRAMTLLDDPQDLIALRTPVGKDVLSKMLQDHWPFPASVSTDHIVLLFK